MCFCWLWNYPVVIGIVEKPEVIAVSKLIKSGLAIIVGKWIVLKPRTQVFISLIWKLIWNCCCMHYWYIFNLCYACLHDLSFIGLICSCLSTWPFFHWTDIFEVFTVILQVKFTAEELRRIMDYKHNIRNMSVIAHVDHGMD